MKVYILTQYFSPEVGATQNRMKSFAKAFVGRGHSVTVITEVPNHPHGVIPEDYRRKWIHWETEDGFEVVRVWVRASQTKTTSTRLAFYLSYMLMSTLAGLAVKQAPDLILATSPPIFTGLSGDWLARLRRAKFILDIRDLWPAAATALGELNSRSATRCAEYLEKYLYRRASLITATTASFCRYIDGFRASAEAVHIPNGTEPDLFSPERVDYSLRTKLGLQDKTVAGYAGLLGCAQDLDLILETAAHMKNKREFRFLILGSGPEERRIKDRARSLQLDNIVFHPQVPVQNAPAYLLACDMLLVPLRNEPLFSKFIPSKLFDYMSCERPVISNVPGETQRILEASGGGISVPGGDTVALADAIIALGKDEERRSEMGKKGRRFVSSRFTRSEIGERIVNRAEKLVG